MTLWLLLLGRARDRGDGERAGARLSLCWGLPSSIDLDGGPEVFLLKMRQGACCSTKAFVDSKGAVYVLYRSATAKVNRDMFLLTSPGAGEPFTGRKLDRWQINACPMSSESLVEAGGVLLGAWETSGQVSFARVNGSGAAMKATPAPGSGPNRKYPALAVNAAGETLMAWAEGTGWARGGDLVWQVFDKSGKPTNVKGRVEGGIPTWSLPAAVVGPDRKFLIVH